MLYVYESRVWASEVKETNGGGAGGRENGDGKKEMEKMEKEKTQ